MGHSFWLVSSFWSLLLASKPRILKSLITKNKHKTSTSIQTSIKTKLPEKPPLFRKLSDYVQVSLPSLHFCALNLVD